MELSKLLENRATPWIMILFGFYSLNILPYMAGLAFMVLGIVMLIERRWPEKWGDEKDSEAAV